MKAMRMWMLCGWLGVAACAWAQGTSNKPPEKYPLLTHILVKFHTNDDDLDHDSQVEINFICNNTYFATADQTTWVTLWNNGGFKNNQSTQWAEIPLHLTPRLNKLQMHACSTQLILHPVGHDTWRFNYYVQLKYADGTDEAYLFENHALNQNTNLNYYPLSR